MIRRRIMSNLQNTVNLTDHRTQPAPSNPRSTAEFAGHPVHPMLISFPIAFLVATLVCDCVYWASGNTLWVTAALWLVGAGTVGGALAAMAGLTDFLGERRIRNLNASWYHFAGNLLVILISAFNWYWHLQGPAGIVPWSIIMSAVVVCLLLFTGWKGWEMVYQGHVGIADGSSAATRN
jgi:uncharacterized membrane protein